MIGAVAEAVESCGLGDAAHGGDDGVVREQAAGVEPADHSTGAEIGGELPDATDGTVGCVEHGHVPFDEQVVAEAVEALTELLEARPFLDRVGVERVEDASQSAVDAGGDPVDARLDKRTDHPRIDAVNSGVSTVTSSVVSACPCSRRTAR